MSNKVSVGIEVPVTISVGDKKLTVSYEEAKAIYKELKNIIEPTNPVRYPNYPVWCTTTEIPQIDTSVQNSITDRQKPI
mgnify:CR=1 FL=1